MADYMENYEYHKIYCDHDIAMRAAFNGDTEKFKEAAKKITQDHWYKETLAYYNEGDIMKGILFQIFAVRSDTEGMKAFAEVYKTFDDFCKPEQLSRTCLITDMIAACICGNDSIIEQAAKDCGQYLIDVAIYFLMLGKKYDLMRRLIPELDKNNPCRRVSPDFSVFDSQRYMEIVISAALYRDKEALRAFFDAGCRPNVHYFCMLCPYLDTMDFLADTYYEYLGYDSAPSFKELFGGDDDGDMLTMMYGILNCNSIDVFDRYAKEISLIERIPDERLFLLKSGIRGENGAAFRRIISDELTIVFKSWGMLDDIFEFAETFDGNVKIDLSRAVEIDAYNTVTVAELIKLLNMSIKPDESDSLSSFVLFLLRQNSRPLTLKMISKGLICAANFDAAVLAASENKWLNVLNALNSSKLSRGQG